MSDSPLTLHRRHLLAATPLPLLATLPALPARAAQPSGGQVIVYVTDVHVDPEDEVKTARARAFAAAIVELDPDLVIHGGDLTEYGSATGLRTWMEMFPSSFRKRVHHVPGNHDAQWIADGYDAYRSEIGPLQHSIDLDDVHISFNNDAIHQQGVADYDAEHRDWLRRDLAKAKGRPILVVGHHILALTPNQIRNGDKVLDILTDAGAHAFLCGHIHSERNNVVNGLTELTGESNAERAGYYQLTRRTSEDSDVFEVERVDIADPTDPTVEPGRRALPSIDLAPTNRNGLRPERAEVRFTANGLEVEVELSAEADAEMVQAAVMGPRLASGTVDNFQVLTRNGNTWSGTLDLSEVPAGENRTFVRVSGPGGNGPIGGNLWHTTIHFENPGFSPEWSIQLRGTVTTPLSAVDDLMIAATTSGQVSAFRRTAQRPRRVWSAQIGPVHNDQVAVVEDGVIFFPSSDHHVYALTTGSGKRQWRTDLGAPAMSDLAVATVDGDRVVFAIAVDTLFCLDSVDGSIRWQQKLAGISGGPALCDGVRVYLGVGDGLTWAFDARTGEPVWSIDQADGASGTYRRLIYGPWQAKRLLLPGDALLACSKDSMRAVDRSTGETIWERTGSFGVSPAPRMWGDQILVLDETGVVWLLDPSTGTPALEVATVPYQKNADFLIRDSTIIVTGVGGLVATVDLDTGSMRVLGQLAPDYVFSSPVLSTDETHYIVATHAGELRGYRLP